MKLYDLVVNAPEIIKETFIHQKRGKNSSVIFQDSENYYLYILIKGHVDVIMQNYSGSQVILYTNKEYSCFGELELFKKDIKSYAAVCQSDCEIISIHQENVFKWMQLDFEFTKFIIEQLTEKLLYSSKVMYSLSLLSIKDRLLNCIYTYDKYNGLSNLTKDQVCVDICTPLRSLNRAIAECRSEGLIDYKNKKFQILSKEKLYNYLAV